MQVRPLVSVAARRAPPRSAAGGTRLQLKRPIGAASHHVRAGDAVAFARSAGGLQGAAVAAAAGRGCRLLRVRSLRARSVCGPGADCCLARGARRRPLAARRAGAAPRLAAPAPGVPRASRLPRLAAKKAPEPAPEEDEEDEEGEEFEEGEEGEARARRPQKQIQLQRARAAPHRWAPSGAHGRARAATGPAPRRRRPAADAGCGAQETTDLWQVALTVEATAASVPKNVTHGDFCGLVQKTLQVRAHCHHTRCAAQQRRRSRLRGGSRAARAGLRAQPADGPADGGDGDV